MEEKSGIYELLCKNCPKKYIGQTSRRFDERYKEHRRAFRYQDEKSSAMAAHCIDEEHYMGEGRIIEEVRDNNKLDAWESLYMDNDKNLVNINEQIISSNLFKFASLD
ncbi:CLUMA_CG013656, isoform A [Clunio marinus]|nr:CLUMA_CG013656, isoform A [Clunio marinus]